MIVDVRKKNPARQREVTPGSDPRGTLLLFNGGMGSGVSLSTRTEARKFPTR
jgi:hypothetical protein